MDERTQQRWVHHRVAVLRRHYHFGPYKISMYLKRYHDIEIADGDR